MFFVNETEYRTTPGGFFAFEFLESLKGRTTFDECNDFAVDSRALRSREAIAATFRGIFYRDPFWLRDES